MRTLEGCVLILLFITVIMNDLIGQFIEIPAWKTFGMIIDEEPPYLGTDKAVRVKVQQHPEDEDGIWFNLEPGEYELLGE